MKHSKKWCKIAAGTLALTGAIATPIALTSCSNTENGPVDPTANSFVNLNCQFRCKKQNNQWETMTFGNQDEISLSVAEIENSNSSGDYNNSPQFGLSFMERGNPTVDPIDYNWFDSRGITHDNWKSVFEFTATAETNDDTNLRFIKNNNDSADVSYAGGYINWDNKDLLVGKSISVTFTLTDKQGYLYNSDMQPSPEHANLKYERTFKLNFIA